MQDTKFPGVIARPMGTFSSKADYHYQTLRCNVDLLNMIQLGITLFNEDGESPPSHSAEVSGVGYLNNLLPLPCTWQFNFSFSLAEDMYSENTIELLQKSGVNFDAHERQGIDPHEFAALLISSGLVMDEDVKWISLHSGYDVAHLAKLMYINPLPDDELQFRQLINRYFPKFYDVKFLLNGLKYVPSLEYH
jgi:CCR4-NOT transcription complex subunit 7/8